MDGATKKIINRTLCIIQTASSSKALTF